MKSIIALAGLALTAYLALRPNPLRDALLELVEVLTELIRTVAGG